MKLILRIAVCGLLLGASSGAIGARLELPLRVSLETLRDALAAQLGASSERPALREGRCRHLSLQSPELEAREGRLQLTAPGSAALGLEAFGHCRNAAAWRGTVQFTLVPQIDPAGRLRVHIVDSQLSDEGAGVPALGLLWELGKRQLHLRLEQFVYDLGASRELLLALLKSAAAPEYGAVLEQALAQLRVLEPRVEADAVVVPIAFEIPAAWLSAPPSAPAPTEPLTEAELDALDKALQPWDAFLVYSLKQIALDSRNRTLSHRLFTLLLDSRYQLTAILSGEVRTAGDPVRALFVEAWTELRGILAVAQREGLLDASLLRYAAFIDAGDALLALDRAAPGLGVRVSADGLRQLARTLRPNLAGDPLAFTWAVDPQLRALFELEELPAPAPRSLAPSRRSWLDLFVSPAYASGRPLDPWVPKPDELDEYEARIAAVLEDTSALEASRASLAAPYAAIYRHLVPTTALIESCWRQYVFRGGKVTYLRSSAGSIGLMQINQHVWRGFYDVERLRWDTAYNARAGARILMRYVKDYAIPYAQRSGNLDDVPRAAYAVYNAGPRAVGRFDKPRPHPREQRVDERLWTLYKGVSSGGEIDLGTCGVSVT